MCYKTEMQHFRINCIATKMKTYQYTNQKIYFDNFNKWRYAVLDSSDLLEYQISSCWTNIKLFMYFKNGNQLHITTV